MIELNSLIFTTHHPNWAGMQALLNILLTVDERQLVINRGYKEAKHLQQENPNRIYNPAGAIPFTEPD